MPQDAPERDLCVNRPRADSLQRAEEPLAEQTLRFRFITLGTQRGPQQALAQWHKPLGLVLGSLEERQGLKVACPEEIAFSLGYIDADRLRALAAPMQNNDYGRYLLALAERRELD